MKTHALYYDDSFVQEFEATVRRFDIEGSKALVVLDKTAFYPEGGGQPADLGTIAGIPVIDVQKTDQGEIRHTLDLGQSELQPGSTVKCHIDWPHRFDYMQQHTGQHVLSAALKHTVSADTVSVHQGAEDLTIEVNREQLTEAEVAAVEDAANEAIRANRAVRTFWTTSEELSGYTLRRPTKRTGDIRLVEIDGWDLVACGGVHLPSTGLVQLVLCTGIERIRGRLRLSFQVGNRALDDYRTKDRVVRSLVDRYSCQPADIPDRVAAEQEAFKHTKHILRKTRERLAAFLVRELSESAGGADLESAAGRGAPAADPGAPSVGRGKPDADPGAPYAEVNRPTAELNQPTEGANQPPPVIARSLEEDPETFDAMVKTLSDDPRGRVCLVNKETDKTRFAVVVGNAYKFPADSLRQHVLTPHEAKGGGKPPLWQGIVNGEPDAFLKAFSDVVGSLEPAG